MEYHELKQLEQGILKLTNSYSNILIMAKDKSHLDGRKKFVLTYYTLFQAYYFDNERCKSKHYYEVRLIKNTQKN